MLIGYLTSQVLLSAITYMAGIAISLPIILISIRLTNYLTYTETHNGIVSILSEVLSRFKYRKYRKQYSTKRLNLSLIVIAYALSILFTFHSLLVIPLSTLISQRVINNNRVGTATSNYLVSMTHNNKTLSDQMLLNVTRLKTTLSNVTGEVIENQGNTGIMPASVYKLGKYGDYILRVALQSQQTMQFMQTAYMSRWLSGSYGDDSINLVFSYTNTTWGEDMLCYPYKGCGNINNNPRGFSTVLSNRLAINTTDSVTINNIIQPILIEDIDTETNVTLVMAHQIVLMPTGVMDISAILYIILNHGIQIRLSYIKKTIASL
ncbi:hypothetical protein V1515DRAFT_611354, partial [Lipomyces mesembrius]